MKRILVTGASGFIGAAIAKHFSKKNKVSAIVRPGGDYSRLKNSGIKIIPVRMQDAAALKKICERVKPEIIFHCAAYGNQAEHYYGKDLSSQLKAMTEVNVGGMANLLGALEKVPFKLFVNIASAFAEYGSGKKKFIESQVCVPRTFYGGTKAAASMLAEMFGRVTGKNVVSMRLTYVYGPGEGLDRFIPTVIKHCLRGEEAPLTSLKEKKDFIYIDDVLDACSRLAALKKSFSGPLNIGSSKEETLGDVLRVVEKKTGRRIRSREGAYKNLNWPGQVWAVDIKKARALLQWKPRHTLEQGIEKTLKWVKPLL